MAKSCTEETFSVPNPLPNIRVCLFFNLNFTCTTDLGRRNELFVVVLALMCVISFTGNLYSGNIGGKIIRMKTDGSEVTVIANLTDTECRIDEPWTHKDCGHPLGVRIDTKGQLYAIDAFLGIMKVDIQTGVVENVFDPRGVSVDGQEILFMNDLVIHEGAGSNGGYVFYMTDMSGGHFHPWSCFIHLNVTCVFPSSLSLCLCPSAVT